MDNIVSDAFLAEFVSILIGGTALILSFGIYINTVTKSADSASIDQSIPSLPPTPKKRKKRPMRSQRTVNDSGIFENQASKNESNEIVSVQLDLRDSIAESGKSLENAPEQTKNSKNFPRSCDFTIPKTKNDSILIQEYDHYNGRRNIKDGIPLTIARSCSPAGPVHDTRISLVEDYVSSGKSFDSICDSDVKQRLFVVSEIFSSEKTYIESLETLVECVYRPLLEENSNSIYPIIDKKTFNAIFGNILEILTVNLEFLKTLEQRLLGSSQDYRVCNNQCEDLHKKILCNWDPEFDSFSDIFSDILPFFKVYSLYTRGYPNALAALENVQKTNDSFNRLVFQNLKSKKVLPLKSYLILPVQRLPRYKLLLESLVKFTPIRHPDFENLKLVHQEMANLVDWVNEKIRDFEEDMKLIDIQRRIFGLPPHLGNHSRHRRHEPSSQFKSIDDADAGINGMKVITPGRQLIKVGKVGKVCCGGCQNRLLVLLSDGIILAKLKSSLSWGEETFDFSHWLPLMEIKLKNVPEPFIDFEDSISEDILVPSVQKIPYLNIPYSFIMISKNLSFQLYCHSKNEKKLWIECIMKAMCSIENNNEKFPDAFKKRHSISIISSTKLTSNDTLYANYQRNSRASTDIDPFFKLAELEPRRNSRVSVLSDVKETVIESDEDLENVAPVWVPDSASNFCMLCESEFNLFRRRHHCRKCGSLICGSCSSKTMNVRGRDGRSCDSCYLKFFSEIQTEKKDWVVQQNFSGSEGFQSSPKRMDLSTITGPDNSITANWQSKNSKSIEIIPVGDSLHKSLSRLHSKAIIESLRLPPKPFFFRSRIDGEELAETSFNSMLSGRPKSSDSRNSNKILGFDDKFSYIGQNVLNGLFAILNPFYSEKQKQPRPPTYQTFMKSRMNSVLKKITQELNDILQKDKDRRIQLSEIYKSKPQHEREKEFRFSIVNRSKSPRRRPKSPTIYEIAQGRFRSSSSDIIKSPIPQKFTRSFSRIRSRSSQNSYIAE